MSNTETKSFPNGLIVKSFSTQSNIELANEYYECHINTLKELKLDKLFRSASDQWLEKSNVYGIAIIDSIEGKMLGGGRIEIHKNNEKLPIFDMIGDTEVGLEDYIESLKDYRFGEIVGVWKCTEASKYGVSVRLIMKSVFCLMKQIPLDYVFGLSSHRIFTALNELGAKKIKALGENGIFYYTRFKIKAAIYYFKLPDSIDFAISEERESMSELLSNPNAELYEKFNGKELKTKFLLKI